MDTSMDRNISPATRRKVEDYLQEKVLLDILLSDMIKYDCALDTNWIHEVSGLEIRTKSLIQDLMDEGVDFEKSDAMQTLVKMSDMISDLKDPNRRVGKDKKSKERLDYIGIKRFRSNKMDEYVTVSNDFKNGIVILAGLDANKYRVDGDTRSVALRKYMPALLNYIEGDGGDEPAADGDGVVRVEDRPVQASNSYQEINEELKKLQGLLYGNRSVTLDELMVGIESVYKKSATFGVDEGDVVDDMERVLKKLNGMRSSGVSSLSKDDSIIAYEVPEISKKVSAYLTRLAKSS